MRLNFLLRGRWLPVISAWMKFRSSIVEPPTPPARWEFLADKPRAGELAVWEAAGMEDARAGRQFRNGPPTRNDRVVGEAYSRGFWREFDRLRFERGDYDLL